MKKEQLAVWLAKYKTAWVRQDADLFVTLFTPDAVYRDTPFMEPVQGREFHSFWRALAKTQQENQIDFDIVARAPPNRAIVNWHATFTRCATSERLEGDGIFVLEFNKDALCLNLREWQHWRLMNAAAEQRSFSWERIPA